LTISVLVLERDQTMGARMEKAPQSQQSFLKTVKGFSSSFWAAIINEIFERGAWYGLLSLIALYLTGPTEEGALGLSHAEKGTILAIVPFFVYLVPLLSGTIGDKIGYKKVLLASFLVLTLGYFSLSLATGYASFFGFFLLVALGAGMFKPMVSGTVARVTRGDKNKASVGFAIFYMVVNLGGFFGPIISGMFRPSVIKGQIVSGSWNYVFYLSAAYMAAMFFFTLFFYKEPKKEDAVEEKSLAQKLKEMVTDLKDLKLTVLLVIFVGFWAMFMQLFYTLPSWIVEWVDTSVLVPYIPFASWISDGQIKAEMIINLDAFAIIFLNVAIAAIVAKFNILKTITGGIVVSALALAGVGFAAIQIGGGAAIWLLLLMIFVFAVGEMMSSPKFTELMGRIAPPGKIGTYQAYGFLSVAGGSYFGGKLSGMYGDFADKTAWYKEILVTKYEFAKELIDGKSILDLGNLLKEKGVDLAQLDQQLWDTNKPYTLWLIYGAIGIATVVALLIYRKYVPSIGEEMKEEKEE